MSFQNNGYDDIDPSDPEMDQQYSDMAEAGYFDESEDFDDYDDDDDDDYDPECGEEGSVITVAVVNFVTHPDRNRRTAVYIDGNLWEHFIPAFTVPRDYCTGMVDGFGIAGQQYDLAHFDFHISEDTWTQMLQGDPPHHFDEYDLERLVEIPDDF